MSTIQMIEPTTQKKSPAERIYVVLQKGRIARLVNAAHPAAVLRYVAAMEYSVRVASQNDLVYLLAADVKVEDSKAEQEPQT